MSTELFLDYLAIRMDSAKAADMAFTVNFNTPDNGEQFVVELSNATLTNIQGYNSSDADLTININRSDLEPVMMGVKTLDQQVADGLASLQGNSAVLEQLKSTLVNFELGFEIMPGTKGKPEPKQANPFEVSDPLHQPE